MEIKLNFSVYDIDHLSHTRCQSFVMEQPERFLLYRGGKASEHPMITLMGSYGTLLFCDSFIHAKIIMAFYSVKTPILMTDEQTDDWVIWVPIKRSDI